MADTESNNSKKTRGTLLVVDGHSLAFRAFFALPVENFSTASGQATNAVWGFATMLSQVIDAEKPDHLAVAFDVKGGTFRNTLLPQYKGTRDAAPEELLTQLPLIQRMLAALGVTYIEKPGYEGDDVIGTLATMGEHAGYHTLVLSGDRDAFQLIDDDVTVLYPGHHFKDLKHMTPEAVVAKYKVTPQQYPDLAALRGETADNIPGVPGVGDGFAAKWINLYGSLDGIVEHADEIGGKKGEALRANIDQVLLNRKVNALVRDVDLGVDIDDLTFGTPDAGKVDELFRELEFGSRTKSRILKTFNGGRPASAKASGVPGTAAAPAAPTESALDVPEAEHAADPAAIEAWEHTIPPSARVTLQAEGDARPGRASLKAIALLADAAGDDAPASALVVEAPFGEDVADALSQLLKRHAGTLAVHGYKEHLHLLAAGGVDLPRPAFDTKLAGYLIRPDFHADTLEQAAAQFLDLHVEDEEKPKATQGLLDFDAEPDGGDAEAGDGNDDGRAAADRILLRHAAIVRALARDLAPKLAEREQTTLLADIELPVSEVLYGMENEGASVDMRRLDGMRDAFAADAEQAQRIAWDNAGSRVNLQSPKQLAKVLFEDMGLKPTKRTKSGSYTTNADALQTLYVRNADDERASGFLGALLRHRETNKLRQIVATLIDTVNPTDGRIHTTFEQTVAATGRLSSVDPNLQNIPNRNAAGREIRSAFVPGEGFVSLMSCDYSQVELRIMAHLSGDEALIEAFRSGADFHRYVASLVYQLPVDEISADQRSHVKAMSYGLAYGLSTYGLSQQLKISPGEAEALKAKYFATFGKVHDFLESCVARARERGYTETMFGRRRYFPALRSTNRVARDAAERAALNAPIQGTAADIMKIAMVRADGALRGAGLASRIILQIHDELVVEIAPGEEEQVTRLVRDAMEGAVRLDVPLDVSTGIGPDWQLAAH
ncbi:DNA polymerase I [Bifidobacterium saguinibicoloris]|uniref:DNA polymerase I n=1 Tax=Bifidobacterium saguinibicoloris TaxID=2834433 RepID=UPI001C59B41F|nr:DNA polymerase I [Bifidobacterium saguinibicoloris]MBW3080664.1 DNA polymerase I [Bifidobacterium saguinibicoloris]